MTKKNDIRSGRICPYCENKTEYVDSSVIYGESYGMIYLCSPCDAYVGVHKGTSRALGRLANYELREIRKQAHRIFDSLWQSGGMTRRQAYKLLGEKMGLSEKLAHIGNMNIQQCETVISIFSKLTPTP